MSEETDGQLFLGRQPILDREQRLFAYELLFRNSSTSNYAEVEDAVAATATVIANALSELGIVAALGSRRGFINVDLEFLFNDVIELLPPQSMVLEILETVPPTVGVFERCRVLKEAGFMLALDDVIQFDPRYAELMTVIDVIKVDVQPLGDVELRELVAKLKPCGKTLLAEKVDTRERMELCMQLGFSLFQGYYFARPTILAGKKIEHSQLSLLKLFGLLLADADTTELEQALKPAPDLVVNLLRLTNSVGAGCREKITSLRHAITVLGRRQLERWLQLMVFTGSKHAGGANPLLTMAATRGRLLELLAGEMRPGDPSHADRAFMVGIMSLMPALIGLPIAEVVAPLGLSSDVHDALCQGSGELGDLLQVTIACESGDIPSLSAALRRLPGLDARTLNRAQAQAMQWAIEIDETTTAA